MSRSHAINLSAAWLPPDASRGRDVWRRRFGRPAGLEETDRLWLLIESAVDCGVHLGDERLPDVIAGRRWRCEVTGRLRLRNELALVPRPATVGVAVDAARGRVSLPVGLGRVILEIESAGFATDGRG